jgi:hypothetical protein
LNFLSLSDGFSLKFEEQDTPPSTVIFPEFKEKTSETRRYIRTSAEKLTKDLQIARQALLHGVGQKTCGIPE